MPFDDLFVSVSLLVVPEALVLLVIIARGLNHDGLIFSEIFFKYL